MTGHWTGYRAAAAAPRGALRRPRRALLRRAARRACTRCSSALRRNARAATRWSATAALELCADSTPRPRASPPAWRRAAWRPATRVAAVHRQPARVRVRAAGAAAPGRDRGAGRRARAAPGPGLHRAASAARCAIVLDAALAARVPHRRRRAGAARCASPSTAMAPTALPAGALPTAAPPPVGGRGRGRHRADPLHLGHHRPAQGRDADAPEHRALGAALPGLHGPGRRRPLGAGGAGQPRHRADRDHRDDAAASAARSSSCRPSRRPSFVRLVAPSASRTR